MDCSWKLLLTMTILAMGLGLEDSFCEQDGDLRLTGGTSALNGKVEICYLNVWGTVCDDSWDDNDAMVVCRQLGYTNPGARSITDNFELTSRPIHLDEVECIGNETLLVNCSASEFSEHDCTHEEDAGVNCETFVCVNGEVRLMDGHSDHNGRVEVCIDNKYVTVCDDDDWGIQEATVVCQQLNLTGPSGSTPIPVSGGMYPLGLGFVSMSNIQCNGSEQTLYDCPHRNTLPSSICIHAGVLCPHPDPVCRDHETRLIGRSPNEGRVEICINGHWGTVCHDGWGIQEAEVVCRHFGYSIQDAIPVGSGKFGRGGGLVLLSNMECSGLEEALSDCPHRNNNIADNFCTHFQDAGVICTDLNNTCNFGELRLVDGGRSSEGRLEICFHNHWGTVCDDDFNEQEASLVCSKLGFLSEGAISLHSAFFGEGVGLILLDDINCTGNETTLFDCSHSGIGTSNCLHDEDISVLCQIVNASCTNGDVRLVDGTGPHSGRVEVCFSGRWGTVCDDNWSHDDATVVCSQLNYTGLSVGLSSSFFGPGSGPIFLDDTKCSADKHKTLIECFDIEATLGVHNCDHSEDAAVICHSENSTCGNVSSGGVRLVGGNSELEGRVEVCLDGKWGTVCDSFWSNFDAVVVCQQLTYSTMNAVALRGAHFGPGTGPIHLDNLFCFGNEEILTDCSHSRTTDSFCTHDQDASVRCSRRSCMDGELRLIGGLLSSEGLVEICINEHFGTICYDGWDIHAAKVVCMQLGYDTNRADSVMGSIFSTASLPTIVSSPSCTGIENNLTECPGLSTERFCPSNRNAGVICYD